MRCSLVAALAVSVFACSRQPGFPPSEPIAPQTPLEMALSRQLRESPAGTVYVESATYANASSIVKGLPDTSAYGRLAKSFAIRSETAMTLPPRINGRPIVRVTDNSWVYNRTKGVQRYLHRLAPPLLSPSGDTALVYAEVICGALCGSGSLDAFVRGANGWQYARTLAWWQY